MGLLGKDTEGNSQQYLSRDNILPLTTRATEEFSPMSTYWDNKEMNFYKTFPFCKINPAKFMGSFTHAHEKKHYKYIHHGCKSSGQPKGEVLRPKRHEHRVFNWDF